MKKFISFALCLTLLLALCLVGCGNGQGKVADNTEHLSTITNSCKLDKSYEGKSFLSEGIGEATVAHFTDGDTLTVNLKKEGTSVAIRFHSVDTPESTGGVEKWGKAASLFVKQQLEKATDVVVEATATPAEPDSYGVRYLGYIWYRNSASENFKNLNLELVENGYSLNKGNDTSKFPYNSYFKKAEEGARSIKLRLFSQKADPLFSTDPVDVSIKEIYENLEQYYNEEYESGSKVRFNALLESVEVYEGKTSFTATQYDRETGEKYTIKLYAGYASNNAINMKLGHLYRVVGVIQKYNNAFQISDLKYDIIFGANNPTVYSHPVQKDYYLTFSSDFTYDIHYSQTLYSDVTVTSVTNSEGVLTIVGTAGLRDKDGGVAEAKTFTFVVNTPDGYQDVIKTGSTFSTKGYQFEENSGTITVLNYSDIILK